MRKPEVTVKGGDHVVWGGKPRTSGDSRAAGSGGERGRRAAGAARAVGKQDLYWVSSNPGRGGKNFF